MKTRIPLKKFWLYLIKNNLYFLSQYFLVDIWIFMQNILDKNIYGIWTQHLKFWFWIRIIPNRIRNTEYNAGVCVPTDVCIKVFVLLSDKWGCVCSVQQISSSTKFLDKAGVILHSNYPQQTMGTRKAGFGVTGGYIVHTPQTIQNDVCLRRFIPFMM